MGLDTDLVAAMLSTLGGLIASAVTVTRSFKDRRKREAAARGRVLAGASSIPSALGDEPRIRVAVEDQGARGHAASTRRPAYSQVGIGRGSLTRSKGGQPLPPLDETVRTAGNNRR